MKRGLVVLDHAEIPEDERAGRVAALQRRLPADGVDVALVYGDVYRSDDVGYLTNLCIYWNEGIVAVPATGDPVFLTKLSPRVHTWMRRTSNVEDLRSGKSFGPLVKELLAGREPGVVGLVEGRLWPATIVADLTAALPGWELRPLGGLVREQRLVPSEHELALLRDGAALMARATAQVTPPGPATAWVSAAERELRGGGYAEVLVDTATTRDGVASIEITGQYRYGWLRAARVVAGTDGPAWASALDTALRAAIGAARDGAPETDLSAAARPALAGLPDGSVHDVAWTNQADLATNGDFERHAGDMRLALGAVGAITIDVALPDGGRAVVADTVLVGEESAECLTKG
ncbi:aminopeptidase P family N-terminal domain-containing protein [Actinomadura alba]|uniref:Aminopeptidase P family N-terminal domain-containing protein n=1 Tax=Actinomadura alba TaxID=406431 RepID=A0ABR7LJR0_9ACTN|nr:aminopeptidase P family N-terminal domain-containing protein [Actinomadura alba]MBC6465091.1 aminopeptidase P family N-terminal domain-containing protein [Actinomadura alba]